MRSREEQAIACCGNGQSGGGRTPAPGNQQLSHRVAPRCGEVGTIGPEQRLEHCRLAYDRCLRWHEGEARREVRRQSRLRGENAVDRLVHAGRSGADGAPERIVHRTHVLRPLELGAEHGHGRIDAAELAQAHLVCIVGRDVERGVATDEIAIVLLATRVLPEPSARRCLGPIDVAQIAYQGIERG